MVQVVLRYCGATGYLSIGNSTATMNGLSGEHDLETCATLQREEWEVLEVSNVTALTLCVPTDVLPTVYTSRLYVWRSIQGCAQTRGTGGASQHDGGFDHK